MNNDVKDIIKKVESIRIDILKYIYDTEHWIFYWIANEEIRRLIEEYPDDFEDYVSLTINSIGNSCQVVINFEYHPDDINNIERYCILSTFRDVVKAQYLKFNNNLKQYKLEQLYEDLEYHKKELKETEKEIKELEKQSNNNKQQNK